MAQSIPSFSNILPPSTHSPCPTCSCPLSHSQSHVLQPPFSTAQSSVTKIETAMTESEATGILFPATVASSPTVDPTLNLPHPTPPEAPSISPVPADVSSAATSAPAPNQVPDAALAPAVASAPRLPPPQHASATDLPSSSLNPNPNRPPKMLMYKNKLQEYAQKSSLPLPEYRTVNEGPPHAPRFRSSVTVGGRVYTSVNTFLHRKHAEQDVAKLSMESIMQDITIEDSSLISGDTVFCKSILNEFATKMGMPKVTYSTVQPQASVHVFVSTVVLNGTGYTGEPGKNKKEAEQLAARAAILSLMGDPALGTVISEIIKSKGKLFDALNRAKGLSQAHNSIALEGVNAKARSDSGIFPTQDLGVEGSVLASGQQVSATQNPFVSVMSQQVNAIQPASVPTPSQQVGVFQVASVPPSSQPVSAIPEAQTASHPPHHEFKVPKQEVSPTGIIPPTEFVPPVQQQPFIAFVPAVQQQFTGVVPNLGKRKNRKNKKKANKKIRAHGQ